MDIAQQLEQELEESPPDFCLYDFIDPEALDRLVESADADTELFVEFEVREYKVVVHSGLIEIQKLESMECGSSSGEDSSA